MTQNFDGNGTERQGAVLPKAGFIRENLHPDLALSSGKVHRAAEIHAPGKSIDSSNNLDASTLCDACNGSGRHAHGFRGGVCSICAGRGWL
jgi:hypothetical protein